MFHKIDADGGGTVDMEEFCDWWMANIIGAVAKVNYKHLDFLVAIWM